MNTPARVVRRFAIASAALVGSTAALAEENGAITMAIDDFEGAASVAPAVETLEASTFSLAAAGTGASEVPVALASSQTGAGAQGQGGQGSGRPRFNLPKPVFDDTWVSIGIGAGLVPSYGGSDDYIVFPLPLIVGRVGGVGISPNGPGFALDLFSPGPALGASKPRFFGGPAFRIRNDRANQIEDEVVELAEDLDWAVEVGAQAGVSFPGVFNPLDTLTLTTQVRWDVAGAHDGMMIEPSVGYARPFGPGVRFQANVGAQFVDDSFADYYYTVTPAQAAATGLPLFTADGGLNNLSTTAIVNFDLDGNLLNGGWSLYTVLGYTRFVGDAEDTPFTSIRGDANNFIGGVGVSYTI